MLRGVVLTILFAVALWPAAANAQPARDDPIIEDLMVFPMSLHGGNATNPDYYVVEAWIGHHEYTIWIMACLNYNITIANYTLQSVLIIPPGAGADFSFSYPILASDGAHAGFVGSAPIWEPIPTCPKLQTDFPTFPFSFTTRSRLTSTPVPTWPAYAPQ